MFQPAKKKEKKTMLFYAFLTYLKFAHVSSDPIDLHSSAAFHLQMEVCRFRSVSLNYSDNHTNTFPMMMFFTQTPITHFNNLGWKWSFSLFLWALSRASAKGQWHAAYGNRKNSVTDAGSWPEKPSASLIEEEQPGSAVVDLHQFWGTLLCFHKYESPYRMVEGQFTA